MAQTGSDFLNIICDALDINKETVRRVVLDIPYNDVVVAYIEQLASSKILEINMQSDGIEIKGIE